MEKDVKFSGIYISKLLYNCAFGQYSEKTVQIEGERSMFNEADPNISELYSLQKGVLYSVIRKIIEMSKNIQVTELPYTMYIVTGYTDMRKSIDGLYSIIASQLKEAYIIHVLRQAL